MEACLSTSEMMCLTRTIGSRRTQISLAHRGGTTILAGRSAAPFTRTPRLFLYRMKVRDFGCPRPSLGPFRPNPRELLALPPLLRYSTLFQHQMERYPPTEIRPFSLEPLPTVQRSMPAAFASIITSMTGGRSLGGSTTLRRTSSVWLRVRMIRRQRKLTREPSPWASMLFSTLELPTWCE